MCEFALLVNGYLFMDKALVRHEAHEESAVTIPPTLSELERQGQGNLLEPENDQHVD